MIGQRTPQSVRNPPARLTAPLSTAARRAEAQRPKSCPQPATSMANRHGRGSAMKARRQPSLAQTTLLTRRLSPQPSPAQSPKSPPAPRMACAPILLPVTFGEKNYTDTKTEGIKATGEHVWDNGVVTTEPTWHRKGCQDLYLHEVQRDKDRRTQCVGAQLRDKTHRADLREGR